MHDPDLSREMAYAMLTHYPDVDEASKLLAEWIEEDETLGCHALVEHLRSPGRNLDVDIQAEFYVDYLDCVRFWQLIWMKTTMSTVVQNPANYNNRLLSTMVLAITRYGIL